MASTFGDFIPFGGDNQGLTLEQKKAIDDALKDALKNVEEPQTGGLIIPISQCCGVPLQQTTGGVIMDYCPKCGRLHQEPRY